MFSSSFPFVSSNSALAVSRISGEVYEVPREEEWVELDRLEGHPDEYERRPCEVELVREGGQKEVITAELYFNDRFSTTGEGVSLVETEKKDILPTVVFIAGLPDSQLSPWPTEIVEHFKVTTHVIFLCLPGFEENAELLPKWGYDLQTLKRMLRETILSTLPTTPDGKKKEFTLIAHDWGALTSLLYLNEFKHDSLVSKVVLLEVGCCSVFRLPFREVLIVVTYQFFFVLAYLASQLIPGAIGLMVGQSILKFFSLPITAPIWPVYPYERKHIEACNQSRLLNRKLQIYYPVYYLWRSLVLNGPINTMPKFPVGIPLLFLHGLNKPCRFHDQDFIKRIHASPDCKEVSFANGGHWFALTEATATLREIRHFTGL